MGKALTSDFENNKYNLVYEHVLDLADSITSGIEPKHEKDFQLYAILQHSMKLSRKIYTSIILLIRNSVDNYIPAQILSRSILEAVFTIAAIGDEPNDNLKRYIKGSYKNLRKFRENNRKRFEQNPTYTSIPIIHESILDDIREQFDLSKNECEKKALFWPNPGQMKDAKFLTDDIKAYFQILHAQDYYQLSELSHQSWITQAYLYLPIDEDPQTKSAVENHVLFSSSLYLIMVITEIAAITTAPLKSNLLYTWMILQNFYHPAKEYYELRYEAKIKNLEP